MTTLITNVKGVVTLTGVNASKTIKAMLSPFKDIVKNKNVYLNFQVIGSITGLTAGSKEKTATLQLEIKEFVTFVAILPG